MSALARDVLPERLAVQARQNGEATERCAEAPPESEHETAEAA